jgi:hypothetical protein
MQSREACQGCGCRGRQRDCLQDPGRPGNAPEGQVEVHSGRGLVGRWRCRARGAGRATTGRRGGCVGAEVAIQKVPEAGDNLVRPQEAPVFVRARAGRATRSATAFWTAWAAPLGGTPRG